MTWKQKTRFYILSWPDGDNQQNSDINNCYENYHPLQASEACNYFHVFLLIKIVICKIVKASIFGCCF